MLKKKPESLVIGGRQKQTQENGDVKRRHQGQGLKVKENRHSAKRNRRTQMKIPPVKP